MHPRRSRTRSLFTLLELIVVIVILGILALLAIPTFSNVIGKAQTSTVAASAGAVGRDAVSIAAFTQQSPTAQDPAAPAGTSFLSEAANELSSGTTATVVYPSTPGPSASAVLQISSGGANYCAYLSFSSTGEGAAVTVTAVNPKGASACPATASSGTTTTTAPTGPTIAILAGSGARGSGALLPTGPALSSALMEPNGTALDASGNLYIADWTLVEKVTPSGTLSVYAGNGTSGTPVPGPATSSPLGHAWGVALDSSGNLYISDWNQNCIEKVTPSGTLSVYFGLCGTSLSSAYGGPVQGHLNSPEGITIDTAGNLLVADSGDDIVARIDTTGAGSVYAGVLGTAGAPTNNVQATSSYLNDPGGVALDASGNLFIADAVNERIEKVASQGTGGATSTYPATLTFYAGSGTTGAPVNGPALSSPLHYPDGVAVDKTGNVYIADTYNQRIEQVTPVGTLTVIAGNGTTGAVVNGPALSSPMSYPRGVMMDSSSNPIVADGQSYVVFKILNP